MSEEELLKKYIEEKTIDKIFYKLNENEQTIIKIKIKNSLDFSFYKLRQAITRINKQFLKKGE
ncbi:MAG: hypothetical protein ACI4VE_05670 [Clostridia bacterium]